ncbi:unnamed protein product, partial [Nesidiocoris tenuis]
MQCEEREMFGRPAMIQPNFVSRRFKESVGIEKVPCMMRSQKLSAPRSISTSQWSSKSGSARLICDGRVRFSTLKFAR